MDIGGGTTDITIFQEGIIRHTAVIAFGGNVITKDIKEGCTVMTEQAEKLKIKFGSALADEIVDNRIITIPGLKGREPKEISEKNLSRIIQARLEEILDLVMYEIRRSGYEKKLIGGIVLTGGGALLKNFELLMPDKNFESVKKLYNKVKLPQEFISFKTASSGLKLIHHYKRAYNYLKERHVTDEIIEKFNIGFCYEGKYANRIIIPSYNSYDDLNYFVARSYEIKPYRKYDNPEAEKQTVIFNEYLIDWNEPIHIVEGPFDSIFLPNAIPMLGKVMSDFLFEKLYENAKKIIIVLDGDAWIDTEKLYYKLNGGKLFGKIWVVKLPEDKDIADLQGNYDNYKPFQIN